MWERPSYLTDTGPSLTELLNNTRIHLSPDIFFYEKDIFFKQLSLGFSFIWWQKYSVLTDSGGEGRIKVYLCKLTV